MAKKKKVTTKKAPEKERILKKKRSPSLFPRKALLIGTAFAVFAILLYISSHSFDFVYDDDAVVVYNRYVHQGIQGLDEIWTTSYFKGYNEHINARAFRPVPLTTLALEYQFLGLNASVNHITNVLLYGFTAFFLFLILSGLFRAHHILIPLLASLFFVIHPIHIEVIANIKSRDEILAFLNFLIAFCLLLQYLDKKKMAWLFASVFFYTIALFSKESALTTLAVIPLALYFFRNLSLKRIALISMPFVLSAVFFLFVRSAVIGGINVGVTLTHLDNSLLAAENFAQRSASNILVLGHYLLKTIFPHPLISDYSFSTIPVVNWNDWRVFASLITYLTLIAAAIWGFRKRKLFSFAILYYFITVSIFTSLIVTNVSAYNDRFLYSPVLGICILVAFSLSLLSKKKTTQLDFKNPFLRNNLIPLALAIGIAVTGVIKLESHLPVWKNRYSLFEHDVKRTPNNARMLKNHGGSLARLAIAEEDAEQKKQLAQEAIGYLESSLQIYWRIATGHIHLGNMYAQLGNYSKAGEAFKNALSIDPNNHSANVNYANILYRSGNYQESVDLLEKLKKSNFTKNDYYLLSLAYGRLGNSEQAKYYRQFSGK
ncbi:MAG: tetratricopeptide repeat protein [Bacteroidetes bacterium]|nr:tetratricopeptide repeat protein [Bacteroidota bacterium]